MKILSLFDGISCARVALERAGIPVEFYMSSEIDPYAIEITKYNWPDTMALGDIKNIIGGGLSRFDLVIGGSPCQDLSVAKNGRKGLDGEKSGLFWEYIRVLRLTNPKYFILENVNSMPKKDREIISEALGVQPIMINASLVSAQSRKRLFWTNIPNVTLPADRGIMLKDILESGSTLDLKSLCVTATYHKKNEQNYRRRDGQMVRLGDIGSIATAHRVYSPEGKSISLSSAGGGQGGKTGLYITQKPRGYNAGGNFTEKSPTVTSSSFEHNNHLTDGEVLRKLSVVECCRLQGLPDTYFDMAEHRGKPISNTQKYKMLGNAFNVDVVAHILSFIPKTI